MRVKTFIHVEQEIEVDVDVGEFIASIQESGDTRYEVLRGLNQVAEFFKGVLTV